MSRDDTTTDGGAEQPDDYEPALGFLLNPAEVDQ